MRRLLQNLLLCAPLLALSLVGCTSNKTTAAASDTVTEGSAATDSGSGDGSGSADTGSSGSADDTTADTATTAPVYERQYPLTETFPAPAGKVWRRSIVHLHSTHSHDACDGDPRVDGEVNAPCLASLRAALRARCRPTAP